MIFKFVLLVMLLFSSLVYGVGHEVEGPLEIPWGTIGAQAFNVLLLFGLLIYWLRHAVIAHFKGRRQIYIELVERAEAAKTAAQNTHREMSAKLQDLQKAAAENVRNAQAEAAILKQKLMSDAETIAKKMEIEAHRSVEIEIVKAKAQLRTELLAEALSVSKEALKNTVGSPEHKRLQTEFADKIQVVGQ